MSPSPQATNLTNHFLIAMPSLKDPNFERSVVYVYEHTLEGTMGLIVNKPLQINLGSVLAHLNIKVINKEVETHPVLMGGPVRQEHGFVIHDIEPDEVQNDEDIVISASKDTLQAIAEGNGPSNYLITLGYSGWSAGQLEREIHRNDWLVAPATREILFTVPIEQRWQESALQIGVDLSCLSDQVGHA